MADVVAAVVADVVEAVVAAGLAGLAAGQPSVHPGRTVAFAATLFRLLPRPLLRILLRRRAARGTPV